MKKISKLIIIIALLISAVLLSAIVLVSCGGYYNANSIFISDYSTFDNLEVKIFCKTFAQPNDQIVTYKYRGNKSMDKVYQDIADKLPENVTATINGNMCYLKRDNGDSYSYFAIADNQYLCNQSIRFSSAKNDVLILVPLFYFADPVEIVTDYISLGSKDKITDETVLNIIDGIDIQDFAEFYNSVTNTTAVIEGNQLNVIAERVDSIVTFKVTFDNDKVSFSLI